MSETPALSVPALPVQQPLTVIMTIKSPEAYAELKAILDGFNAMPPEKNPVIKALDLLGIVHFARFVFLDDNTKFGIITTFDNDFEEYILKFAAEIGQIFDIIHSHMIDSPPLPVKDHPKEFLDYIKAHNVTPVSFYSAYPTLTVEEIKGKSYKSAP